MSLVNKAICSAVRAMPGRRFKDLAVVRADLPLKPTLFPSNHVVRPSKGFDQFVLPTASRIRHPKQSAFFSLDTAGCARHFLAVDETKDTNSDHRSHQGISNHQQLCTHDLTYTYQLGHEVLNRH